MSRRVTPPRVIDLTRFKYPEPAEYDVRTMFIDYSREKVIAKGKDPIRNWHYFNEFMRPGLVEPSSPAKNIGPAQFEDYEDARIADGVALSTVNRELTAVLAAMHHAVRRRRMPAFEHVDLPSDEGMERRPLNEEEFRLVISKPMSPRLFRFYWTAYHTGHRARAIEELTWDRTNLVTRQIDFNVPGRRALNKRRANDFPITDDFLPLLKAWHDERTDNYVIGLSRRGFCSPTYREAQHVVRVLCGLTDKTLAPRHCMRAMYATEMFEKGENSEVIAHLMRDRPETLRKRYVKYKHSKLLAVANRRSANTEAP